MSDNSPNNWNENLINEFRANGGKVAGMFAGASLLLLTTTGARTGRRLTSPLMYGMDSERIMIFASKAGAPTNPDWYHNLVANPRVTVEMGTETFEADALVTEGDERDRLFTRHAEKSPQFAEYQANTTRKIPVVALVRVS
ncbi:MAG: nitroreductase family deazaflavin-dependent oxidoreductase [Sphingomicrobium sp.]